jgi:hypothetical protein
MGGRARVGDLAGGVAIVHGRAPALDIGQAGADL